MKRIAAVLAAIFAIGIAGSSPAVAAQPGLGQPKVWVCKYVQKPGQAETLKSGKQPIEVSNRAAGLEVGDEFSDAHGRSVVVQVGGEDPGSQACDPTPPPPNKVIDYEVDGYVCGDPRLVTMLSNTGNVPIAFGLRFVSARYGTVKTPEFIVKPGKTIFPKRWVQGRTQAWVSFEGDRVFQTAITRAVNIGPCPTPRSAPFEREFTLPIVR